MSDRQLLVSKIENGIVIDHIPAGKAFLVMRLLKLNPKARVVIAQNVDSRSLGTKDLIKIEGTYLTSKEIDLIALVAPSATLNIVENWRVKETRRIKLPEQVEGIFKCPNPLCPTNSKYSPSRTRFKVETEAWFIQGSCAGPPRGQRPAGHAEAGAGVCLRRAIHVWG